ncbi:MAG: hypothetical protein KDB22_22430, partial [Planctomycetales bacterium]|nr:hypothetical protein [Planctomycetales bacterium]
MGRIQSSVGLVTGVAIEETVNQLIQLNALPRQRLESRNALLEREQVAIAELTALVVGVQLSTDRLGQSTLFSATSVTSSNKDALAVRSSGAPTPGNYSFIPVRQAQNQQLTSSLFSSSDYKLNEGEIVINTGGFLDSSISLDELNGGEGVSRGYLRITDKSGTSQSVDLRFAQDAQDVVDAINATDNLGVVASIDGDHFVLTDVSGGNVGNLSVSEVSGGTTASDLGLAGISTASNTASGTSVQALTAATGLSRLLDNRGLDIPTNGVALQFQLQDGSSVDLNTKLISNTASLGQLIDEINDAGDGKLQASISASGKTIEIQDLTSGTATFSVSSPAGTLAEQLGLDNASVGGLITSDRLIAGLSDVLLSSLGGGQGLGTLGQIAITDRSGASDTIDLSSATTLDDVINAFNESSVSVTAQLNRTKTGIELIDTTGATASDLIIANADATNSATALQLESSSASVRIDSGSLNLQFVTNNTKIADFNQGRGVRFGSIQFTDSTGETSAINLATLNPTTIGDVVNKINKLGIGVSASINETGDGLLLVDTAGGSGTLKVEDINGGSAALDLGIAGTATTLNVNGQEESGIDGSLTIRIKTDAETTLADLAEKINALEGSPVSASILNLNASGGVRLLLNSNASGSQGRVTIAGEVGIGFSETSEGRDALLAFGANESSGGVLVSSSSNDFTGLVDDLEFTITGTSTTPVTVSVSQS